MTTVSRTMMSLGLFRRDTVEGHRKTGELTRYSPFASFRTGQTGLGKSTLINTIFASHLIDTKGRFEPDEPVRQTTEIQAVSHSKFCSFANTSHPQTELIAVRYFSQSCKRTTSDSDSTLSIPLVTEISSTTKTGKLFF